MDWLGGRAGLLQPRGRVRQAGSDAAEQSAAWVRACPGGAVLRRIQTAVGGGLGRGQAVGFRWSLRGLFTGWFCRIWD